MAIIVVVHVDDIFIVERKSRYDGFRGELNLRISVNSLRELR